MASYWPLVPHVLQGVVICLLLFLDFMLTRRRNRLQLKQALDKQKMESMYPKRHVSRSYRVVPCPPVACPTPVAKSAPPVFGSSAPVPPGALSLGLKLEEELAGETYPKDGSLVTTQDNHDLRSPTRVETYEGRSRSPSVVTSALTAQIFTDTFRAVQGTICQPGSATTSVEEQKAKGKEERKTSSSAGAHENQTSPVPLRKPNPDQLLKPAASKSTVHGRYPRADSGKVTQESKEAVANVWETFPTEISHEEPLREHSSQKLQRHDRHESHAGPAHRTSPTTWRVPSTEPPEREQPPPPPPAARLIAVQPSFESDSLPESDQGLLRQARGSRRKSPRQTGEKKRPKHIRKPRGGRWEFDLSSPTAETWTTFPPSDPASAPFATADRPGGQPGGVAHRAKSVPACVGPHAEDAEDSLVMPSPRKKHKKKKRKKHHSSSSLEQIAP